MELSVYISGKITGEEHEACKKKFASMEAKLKKLGVDTVINPMNMGIPETWTWSDAMELCMKVLKEKANSIIMLNDWISSNGAMKEYYHARNYGYRIFMEDDTEELVKVIAHSGKWIDTSHLEIP